MFLVLAIINSILIVKSSTSDINVTCDHSPVKPSKEILKQQYNIWLERRIGLDPTFDLVPYMYKTRYRNTIIDKGSELRKRIYGRPKCHKTLNKNSDDLMDISICPWFVEMTYDRDRYPEQLASAICKCKHCYSLNGELNVRSKHLDNSKCIEIKQIIKVLRIQKNKDGVRICQSNNNKIFLYKNSYEEITVGCTCALKGDKRIGHSEIKTNS